MGTVTATVARRLLIATLWFCFSATLAWAQQADIDRADRLMKEGKAAEAFAILDPLEDKMAGDVNFDYLFGISALDSGKSDRATIAFERVLAVNPNFAGARLDLARAYFQLGDIERAKTEFETVRGQNPPDAVRQVVATYLATIDKAQAAKRRLLRTYVEGTIGRDSNVNLSTGQSLVQGSFNIGGTIITVPLTLSSTNVRRRDSFSAVATGVDFLEQIDPRLAIFAGADYRKRANFTADIFDNSNLDARAGVLLGAASNQIRLGASGGRYTGDNVLTRKTTGLNGEWKYQLDPANQFNIFTQNTHIRFMNYINGTTGIDIITGAPATSGANRNSINQTTSGLGWLRIFGDGKAAAFGNYFFGKERDTDIRADGLKTFDGVRIGGQYLLQDNLDMFAVASAQTGKYERLNPSFVALGNRRDRQSDLVLGATWRFAVDWSLRPQILHSRNSSNIPLNSNERTEVSISVRRDFN